MTPVEFPEQTVIYAKDQPEYQPLPAHVTREGVVTSCWELDPIELEMLAATGKLWISQHTFKSPLQPILPSVIEPPFHLLETPL